MNTLASRPFARFLVGPIVGAAMLGGGALAFAGAAAAETTTESRSSIQRGITITAVPSVTAPKPKTNVVTTTEVPGSTVLTPVEVPGTAARTTTDKKPGDTKPKPPAPSATPKGAHTNR